MNNIFSAKRNLRKMKNLRNSIILSVTICTGALLGMNSNEANAQVISDEISAVSIPCWNSYSPSFTTRFNYCPNCSVRTGKPEGTQSDCGTD